jgi:hypothetical protein
MVQPERRVGVAPRLRNGRPETNSVTMKGRPLASPLS